MDRDYRGRGTGQIRYRYRTAALAGRWRDSREEALRDAVRAHQAIADEGVPGGLRWLVSGEIEEMETAEARLPRLQRR